MSYSMIVNIAVCAVTLLNAKGVCCVGYKWDMLVESLS